MLIMGDQSSETDVESPKSDIVKIEICPTIESYTEDNTNEPNEENIYHDEEEMQEMDHTNSILRMRLTAPGISTTHSSSTSGVVQQNIKTRKRNKSKVLSQSKVQTKLLECPDCERCFRYLSDLKRHAVTHSTERPFVCDICSKNFGRAFNLKEHLKTHIGDKPFACNICNKKFGRMFDLKVHSYIHSGERPYKCTVCNKDYKNSSNLNKHVKSHNKDDDIKEEDN